MPERATLGSVWEVASGDTWDWGEAKIKPPARCRSFHYLCSRLGEKSAADKGGTREVTVQRLRDVDEMVFFDPS